MVSLQLHSANNNNITIDFLLSILKCVIKIIVLIYNAVELINAFKLIIGGFDFLSILLRVNT